MNFIQRRVKVDVPQFPTDSIMCKLSPQLFLLSWKFGQVKSRSRETGSLVGKGEGKTFATDYCCCSSLNYMSITRKVFNTGFSVHYWEWKKPQIHIFGNRGAITAILHTNTLLHVQRSTAESIQFCCMGRGDQFWGTCAELLHPLSAMDLEDCRLQFAGKFWSRFSRVCRGFITRSVDSLLWRSTSYSPTKSRCGRSLAECNQEVRVQISSTATPWPRIFLPSIGPVGFINTQLSFSICMQRPWFVLYNVPVFQLFLSSKCFKVTNTHNIPVRWANKYGTNN